MVNKYHKSVEDAVVKFGKDHKSVKKVFRGNENPIPIADSASKKMINYKPDAYFILKNRYKLLFQVLESELKKQDTIIADIVRACLVENCLGIIFLYPSNKQNDRDRVFEALYTVIRGLNKKGMPIEELPQRNNCYYISRELASNQEEIIKLLSERCKEDGWFK